MVHPLPPPVISICIRTQSGETNERPEDETLPEEAPVSLFVVVCDVDCRDACLLNKVVDAPAVDCGAGCKGVMEPWWPGKRDLELLPIGDLDICGRVMIITGTRNRVF